MGGLTAGLDGCEKSRLHRDSIPDLPDRSESLYRLSYPGSLAVGSNVMFLITSLRASHMPMASGLRRVLERGMTNPIRSLNSSGQAVIIGGTAGSNVWVRA